MTRCAPRPRPWHARPALWLIPLAVAIGPASLVAGTSRFDLGLDAVVPSTPGFEVPAVPGAPPREVVPVGRQMTPTLLPPSGASEHLPGRVRRDVAELVAAPLDWRGRDWRRLGLAVAAVGAVSLLDDEIHGVLDRTRTPSTVRAAETVRPLGQEGGLLLLGGAWLAGRTFDRPALTEVGRDGLEATILAAGIITPALKALTGRSRPRNSRTSLGFRGGESFPSGETTEAFAIASVVSAHSDSGWARASAWTLAGLVGLSRMELDAHWASDVAAGALIGTAVGRWVVRRHRPDLETGRRVTMVPEFGDGRYGVAMRLSF